MSGDKIAARLLSASLVGLLLAASVTAGGAGATRDQGTPADPMRLPTPESAQPESPSATAGELAAMLASELLLIGEQYVADLPVVLRQ